MRDFLQAMTLTMGKDDTPLEIIIFNRKLIKLAIHKNLISYKKSKTFRIDGKKDLFEDFPGKATIELIFRDIFTV